MIHPKSDYCYCSFEDKVLQGGIQACARMCMVGFCEQSLWGRFTV